MLYKLYKSKTGFNGRVIFIGDMDRIVPTYLPYNPTEDPFETDNILDKSDMGIFSNLLTYCISLFLDETDNSYCDGKNYYLYHHRNEITKLFPSSIYLEEVIFPDDIKDIDNDFQYENRPLDNRYIAYPNIHLDEECSLDEEFSLDSPDEEEPINYDEFIICGFDLYEYIERIIRIRKNVSNIIQYYEPLIISHFYFVRECLSSYKKELADIIIVLAEKYKQLFCDNRINYLLLVEGIDHKKVGENRHIVNYLCDEIILREVCLYFCCDNKYWMHDEVNQLLSLVHSM